MAGGRYLRGLCAAALVLAGSFGASPARAAPYSSHSQMHSCCTDSVAKRAMFSEAKASGAAYIRVAFEMHGIAPDPADSGRRYWEGPDDVAQLSREFQLPVVAVPLGVSHGESSCPDAPFAQQTLCPPRDSARWAGLLGELAARYAGVINHFEVWNEPDGAWAFRGEPEDYAWMLSRSYDAIKARAPAATVLIAGTMYPDARGNGWLDRVFATPGADAATKFDIGTVHLRGAPDQMVADLRSRQALWAKWGRRVPTWVTEHGSPSDPAFQLGAPVPSGEAAQAAYLARSLPALGLAGADQVFVTLRDEGAGEFASEGIVAGRGLPDSPFRRKLAWQTVLDATRAWPMVLALANRPPPVAFRSGFLVASARVPKAPRVEASSDRGGPLKHGRRRVMAWSRSPTTRFPVELRGRFAGSGCAGQVRLTYRLGRARPTVRIAAVDAGCRYAVNTVVRVPTTTKLPARLSIRQQFLGSETTRSGSAKPLTVKLRARPAPKLKRPRRAPSARRAAP